MTKHRLQQFPLINKTVTTDVRLRQLQLQISRKIVLEVEVEVLEEETRSTESSLVNIAEENSSVPNISDAMRLLVYKPIR